MTTVQGLRASPWAYPLQLAADRRSIGVLALSEADYAAASFLDERLASSTNKPGWLDWRSLEAAAAGIRGESDFIFHIGHVGSTLLSRLLGRHPGIFALREPAILRTLTAEQADPAFAERLAVMLRLYARVWRPDQRSLVKATSFVADIGSDILALFASAVAILIFVAPQVFIATILAGDATRAELAHVTPWRLARLAQRLAGARLAPASTIGEMAAAGWACEMAALAGVALSSPDRVLWVDFDRLLSDPRGGLSRIMRRLRPGEREDAVAFMLDGPELGQYSKAPEHPFDAEARQAMIDRAMRVYRDEIERGLAWLDATGAAHPAIARASRAAAIGRTSIPR